jgi:hypothetical protein
VASALGGLERGNQLAVVYESLVAEYMRPDFHSLWQAMMEVTGLTDFAQEANDFGGLPRFMERYNTLRREFMTRGFWRLVS